MAPALRMTRSIKEKLQIFIILLLLGSIVYLSFINYLLLYDSILWLFCCFVVLRDLGGLELRRLKAWRSLRWPTRLREICRAKFSQRFFYGGPVKYRRRSQLKKRLTLLLFCFLK